MSGTSGSSTDPVLVRVIGIGADGWEGLPDSTRALLAAATTVLGGERQLDLLPPIDGQERTPLPRPLREGLSAILRDAPDDLVILASGDPLVSGIGATVIELLGTDAVEVIPSVSSVALARARLGWAAESCGVVSVVGRSVDLVRRELAPGRRLLVLSSDERTPSEVAHLLTEAGFGSSRMTVLGDLGGPAETRTDGVAGTWAAPAPRLNVVAVEVGGAYTGIGWAAGLPDDAYENDGQLTKRDLRASALARLAPAPGEHLWDVGAGAGSVGIEWMRAHPSCRTTAIEADAGRAERIGRNAARLGVPTLQVVLGRAPEVLDELDAADAIFIGGGATGSGVLDRCLAALRPGGRLVVHGVTLETERVLSQAYHEHGGELTRIGVETAAPVGTFTGWTPARAVTQWALTR